MRVVRVAALTRLLCPHVPLQIWKQNIMKKGAGHRCQPDYEEVLFQNSIAPTYAAQPPPDLLSAVSKFTILLKKLFLGEVPSLTPRSFTGSGVSVVLKNISSRQATLL